MAELYIAGSLLGVVMILAIGMWIKSRRKRHSDVLRLRQPAKWREAQAESSYVGDLLASPVVWTVLFFVLVLAVLGATAAILTGAFELGESAWTAVLGLFGALFVGFVTYNVYAVARNRGHSSALSIAESLAVLSLIAVAGVAALLVLG